MAIKKKIEALTNFPQKKWPLSSRVGGGGEALVAGLIKKNHFFRLPSTKNNASTLFFVYPDSIIELNTPSPLAAADSKMHIWMQQPRKPGLRIRIRIGSGCIRVFGRIRNQF